MRSGLLRGRDHHEYGAVATIAEGAAAIGISIGGFRKQYPHTDPNEDAVAFALGSGGLVAAIADGHQGESGAVESLTLLLEQYAPRWTGEQSPFPDETAWRENLADSIVAANTAILERSARSRLPPAHTTLSIVVARPRDDLLAHASMGDSHAFVRTRDGIRDLGWGAGENRRTYFLGYEEETTERVSHKCVISCDPARDAAALVLATDGISEVGIGVGDPGREIEAALDDARAEPGELRPLAACRGIVEIANAAHVRNRAGDNIACAVLDLCSTA